MKIFLLLGLALTVAGQTCDPPMSELPYGEVVCTSLDGAVGDTCTYKCTAEKYEMVPATSRVITCLANGEWDKRAPCCQRCDKAADIVVVVDSSGSIKQPDYVKMKGFIADVIGSFSSDQVHFAILRFSTLVDKFNAIKFGKFNYDNEKMQEAAKKLPGSGGKTALGAALTYTRTAMLKVNNRRSVPDVIWVITDGNPTDTGVENAAELLRQQGAEIFALGIKQEGEPLSYDKLVQIAGSEDNVIEVKGMKALKEELRSRIVNQICDMKCPYTPTTPPPPPSCNPNPPDPPIKGKVDCDNPNAEIGTTCTFTCASDHLLKGPKETVCKEPVRGGNPEWSHEADRCVKKCKKPDKPDYGTIKCSNLDNQLVEGSSCTFKCNEGYRVLGATETECDSNGEWSEKTPTCEPMCKPHPPAKPENGAIECDNDKGIVGTVCDYACDPDHLLEGFKKTVCKKVSPSKAEWSNGPPKCTKKCKKPDPPTYGTVTCEGELIVGDKCTFKCNEGYEKVGPSKSVCQADGTMSEEAPKCIPTCKPNPPPGPENGSVDCDKKVAVEGTICSYKCKSGHKLTGSEKTVCEQTVKGKVDWSNKPPKCIKTCTKPPTIDHGTVDCNKPLDSMVPGTVCKFKCEDGYNQVEDENAVCEADGTWKGTATCEEEKECDKWNKLENGKITCTNEKYVPTTKCFFECDSGYVMIPGTFNTSMCDEKVISTENGKETVVEWTNPLPCCGKVVCKEDAEKDIILVVDSSGSVDKHYDTMKTFLNSLVDGFSGSNFRLGLVRFGSKVETQDTVFLNQWVGEPNKLKTHITNMKGPGGKTYTSAALRYTLKKVVPTGRSGVKDAALVLTDGSASDKDELKAAVDALVAADVHLIALGIGEGGSTIDTIAQGKDENKIVINGMEELTDEIKDQILSKFCSNTCETEKK